MVRIADSASAVAYGAPERVIESLDPLAERAPMMAVADVLALVGGRAARHRPDRSCGSADRRAGRRRGGERPAHGRPDPRAPGPLWRSPAGNSSRPTSSSARRWTGSGPMTPSSSGRSWSRRTVGCSCSKAARELGHDRTRVTPMRPSSSVGADPFVKQVESDLKGAGDPIRSKIAQSLARAHRPRAGCRGVGRQGIFQPRGGSGALREPEGHRVPPAQHLREAGHHLTAWAAGPRDLAASPFSFESTRTLAAGPFSTLQAYGEPVDTPPMKVRPLAVAATAMVLLVGPLASTARAATSEGCAGSISAAGAQVSTLDSVTVPGPGGTNVHPFELYWSTPSPGQVRPCGRLRWHLAAHGSPRLLALRPG